LGIPTLLLLGGYYYFYQSHSLGIALMISSIFFPLIYAPNTWDSFLQGKSRFDVAAKYSSIQALCNTIATGAVIFLSRNSLIPIVISYLVSYTFFNGYYYFKSLKFIENKKTEGDTVKYGWFLTKMNLFALISGNIDKLLVGAILGMENLAIYYVISALAMKIKDIEKVLASFFIPKLSIGDVRISTILKQKKSAIFIFMAILLSTATIYFFAAPYVTKLLFSSKYSEYADLSRFFVVSLIFVLPGSFLVQYAQSKKNRITIAMQSIAFNVIRLAMYYIGLRVAGILGIIIAYNASVVVSFLFYVFGIMYEDKREG
jgi:O-antigen/teichoic acid export membrane protein